MPFVLYLNLTDTDSCSFTYVFVCSDEYCFIKESAVRNMIFKIIVNSKILERLDTSHEFWEQFKICKPELYEQVGLYKIDFIDNPNTITISISPKELLQKFEKRCKKEWIWKLCKQNIIFKWNLQWKLWWIE